MQEQKNGAIDGSEDIAMDMVSAFKGVLLGVNLAVMAEITTNYFEKAHRLFTLKGAMKNYSMIVICIGEG